MGVICLALVRPSVPLGRVPHHCFVCVRIMVAVMLAKPLLRVISPETPSLWRAWPASGGFSPKGIERSRGDEGHPFWIDLTRSVAPLLWLKQICLVKTETETMKAMNTPAAKAKGMKPETKTMKAMKTPAAKAKGIKPTTLPLARMKTPAAKAQEMKPDTATELIIDGAIRVTTPMSPCEILRCLLPPRQHVIDVE